MKWPDGDGQALIPPSNLTIVQGTQAAMVAQQTEDLKRAKAVRNPEQNPHLAYLDSDANGYSLATVTGKSIDVRMVAVHVAACGFEDVDDEGDWHECGQDGWLCATALRLQGGTHVQAKL